MNPFTPANKTQSKLKLAITGASGSGKTWTALMIATEIANREQGKIALIDTEGGSASKYADHFTFDVLDISGDYSPMHYINAINAAVQYGYSVVVIDSASHAWGGSGGVLEIADRSKKGNNKFSGWATARPVQNQFVDTLLNARIHLIATMRSKTAYEMVERNGKLAPVKIGLAPVQDSDFEYEFDVVLGIDQSHTMHTSKSRCSELDGVSDITDATWLAGILHGWVTSGDTPQVRAIDSWMTAQYMNELIREFDIQPDQHRAYRAAVDVPEGGNMGDSTLSPKAFRDAIVAQYQTLQGGSPDGSASGEWIDGIEDGTPKDDTSAAERV